MLPVHGKVLVTLSEELCLLTSPAPVLSSCQSSALGPQERTPWEVSVHLRAQWISGFPYPSFAPELVVSFFRWPSSLLSRSPILTVSPTGSRWRLSLQPTYLRSRPSEERKTRAQPFLLSRPPRSAPQPSAYIALAATWSRGYI